jgi:hypothetical protein
MNADIIALVLGTVLAVGALAFVMYPLFVDTPERVARVEPVQRESEQSAVRALREIEFDRATGKLSDSDYESLRANYSQLALVELRGGPVPSAAPIPEDEIEARVRAYRAARRDCKRCGLRPEPDAIYCSTCGDYLGGACPACSAPVTETSATFCSTCGVPLAAPQVA